MNYLIKWQFTKKNPLPFKTQAEIINSNLIPLSEDKSFQEKKFSFYITKVYLTNARLGVFAEKENFEEIKNIVGKYTKELIINPRDPTNEGFKNNDWDGTLREFPFPDDCTKNFYIKYLQDITLIGLGLHKKDLTLAVPVAIDTAYKTMRIMAYETENESLRVPIIDTRFYDDNKKLLNNYFAENSESYKKKKQEEINDFWSNCGFYFKSGSTWGPHFYYDIVLGLDPFNFIYPNRYGFPIHLPPCKTFLNFIINVLRGYNLNTNLPSGINCSQEIVYLINQALTHN